MRAVFSVVCLTGCDTVFLDRGPLEDCPLDYEPLAVETTRYRLSTTQEMWATAQADCADDTPLAITHLAVIDTFTEIDSIHTHSDPKRLLWIGYARDHDSPQFFNVLGDPLLDDSSLWNGNEPNNFNGKEFAVELNESGLNDTSVDSRKYYVCECDGRKATRAFDFGP